VEVVLGVLRAIRALQTPEVEVVVVRGIVLE
jgi:hypothetical protein